MVSGLDAQLTITRNRLRMTLLVLRGRGPRESRRWLGRLGVVLPVGFPRRDRTRYCARDLGFRVSIVPTDGTDEPSKTSGTAEAPRPSADPA